MHSFLLLTLTGLSGYQRLPHPLLAIAARVVGLGHRDDHVIFTVLVSKLCLRV